MAFDVEGARKAGYSDAEIADHLATTAGFDAPAARKAGYGDAELIQHLTTAEAPPATTAEPNPMLRTDPNEPQTEAAPNVIGHKLGLGVRNFAQGVIGGAYDVVGAGLRKIGLPVNKFAENLTALGLPEAETPFERGAGAAIEGVASAVPGVGVGRGLSMAASPTVQRVGAALAQQPVTQAVAGGVGGGVAEATDSPTAGLAAGAITSVLPGGAQRLARAAVPNATVGDAALGQVARGKYGIDVTAPDLTSNQFARNLYDQTGKVPLSGATEANRTKLGQWMGAIATEMGERGVTGFTADVMRRARDRIGQQFDDVAARTAIPPAQTTTLLTDLQAILPQARQVLTEAELRPLELQIQNIAERVGQGSGTIGGDAYQALTRAKAPLDLAESSTNPNVSHFAGQIRDALDDAFVRSASSADQAALTQARYQYRVMRTVDPLVAGSRDGNISPDAFMQKVLTASRRFDSPTGGMAYTGGGNIGELARIGKLFRAPPQTGSADRAWVNFGAGAAASGGLGAINPWAALTVPLGLAANRGVGAALRSDAMAEATIARGLGTARPLPNPLYTAADVAIQEQARRTGRQD